MKLKVICACLADMYYNKDTRSQEYVTLWPAWQEIASSARLFPYWRLERKIGRRGMNDLLLNWVTKWGPDLLFVATWHDNFLPGVLERIGEKIPVVAWFSDAYRQDHIRTESVHYTHCVVMDSYARSAVVEGKPVMESMWACNPKIHKTWDPARPIGVIYAGKDQPDRRPFVEHMLATWPDQDINRIHSDNVPGALPLMEPELYAKMHGSAKVGISLSLNVEGWPQPKTRPFELAGCGVGMLVSRPNTLGDWFREGQEFTSFATKEEMVSDANYYLANVGEREKMARAAQYRAHNEHTYAQRLLEVVRWVM